MVGEIDPILWLSLTVSFLSNIKIKSFATNLQCQVLKCPEKSGTTTTTIMRKSIFHMRSHAMVKLPIQDVFLNVDPKSDARLAKSQQHLL